MCSPLLRKGAHPLLGKPHHQPFPRGTCLPCFLSTGPNLPRAYLDKKPSEAAKTILRLKQNLPFLRRLISAATGMSLTRGLFVPLTSLRMESGQVRISSHKGNYLQTWEIWGLSDSKDLVLDFLKSPKPFRRTRCAEKMWEQQ